MNEDLDFLNDIDRGVIGISRPQVKFIPDPYKDVPRWIINRFQWEARREGLELEEWLDKYEPSFDSRDWDDRGNAEFNLDKEEE